MRSQRDSSRTSTKSTLPTTALDMPPIRAPQPRTVLFTFRHDGVRQFGIQTDDCLAHLMRILREVVRCCGCQLGCHSGQGWRGWMGIEPTQDASTAPRKRF